MKLNGKLCLAGLIAFVVVAFALNSRSIANEKIETSYRITQCNHNGLTYYKKSGLFPFIEGIKSTTATVEARCNETSGYRFK